MDARSLTWVVLNGKSAGDDAVRSAVASARSDGAAIEVRVTWEGGDAERIVREAIQCGAACVMAAGGDGTASEVATALLRSGVAAADLPSMGILPLGTANDFATSAGIPMDPAAALQLACTGRASQVDALRIDADGQEHWALNMASGGFGTAITTETQESLKRALGGLAYVVTGLGKLRDLRPFKARVSGDDLDWKGEFIALGIGNGRQAGGGQVLCPDAHIDDGLFDLTIIPPLEQGWLETLGMAVVEGRDAALDRVALRKRAMRMQLESLEPDGLTLNLDGEPVTAAVFQIECQPARLRLQLPSTCPLLGGADDNRAH